MTHTLHLDDCRIVLSTLDDASIDAIVCDPPYELGFMGKAWDNSGIAYDVTVWQQCYRVLKPGGHLIAFGGSRTYHRLAVAIEDAGFEIRDQIQWIYASGFPKSHNLKDEWKGFGTALKPAHEPAVLARKPLCGTVADNVKAWGVGAINVDATRVGTSKEVPHSGSKIQNGYSLTRKNPEGIGSGFDANIGRWPANVILDEEAAQILDEQSGHSVSSASMRRNNGTDSFSRGKFVPFAGIGHSDSGGASRFFYVAKASKAEREAGLDGMERVKAGAMDANTGDVMQLGQASLDGNHKSIQPRANHHPTVKPIALMRYLVRLVTPKGGKVLDPFMGSGSTGCAAVLEGCDFVGIDITPEYVAIAQKRIAHYAVETPLEGLL